MEPSKALIVSIGTIQQCYNRPLWQLGTVYEGIVSTYHDLQGFALCAGRATKGIGQTFGTRILSLLKYLIHRDSVLPPKGILFVYSMLRDCAAGRI